MGKVSGLSSPRNGVDILETQHLPKKKRQGRSGLISALGRKVAFRQMIQEPLNVSHANRLDRDGAHKFQESLDPTTVSLFGLGGVSTRVEYATKAIKGLSGSSRQDGISSTKPHPLLGTRECSDGPDACGGPSQADFNTISNTSPPSLPRFRSINSWQSR